MKRLHFRKYIALLLILVMTAAVVPSVQAYGTEDSLLIVTHANVVASYEGAAIIYTSVKDDTITSYGTFEWWTVVVFEWDKEDGVYKVTSVDNTMGRAKSGTEIPENGFIYAVNIGNNYPELYKKDPDKYASYKNSPNYINESATLSFELAGALQVGDTAYCYGGDFLNGSMSDNGKLWYSAGYESETYIKIGDPEITTDVPFDPVEAAKKKVGYVLGINKINAAVAEGQATVFTPKWGETIREDNIYSDFSWFRVAVFDWSDSEGAYVVTSVSTDVASNIPKDALIPKNGFVLTACIGNDYSVSGGVNYINKVATGTYNALENVEVGDHAYLVGIDIDNGTAEMNDELYYSDEFETKAKIYLNVPPETGNSYRPDTSLERLDSPFISGVSTIHAVGDITVSWEEIESASVYYVSLQDISACSDGEYVFANEHIDSGDGFVIDESMIEIGRKYRLTVVAAALGYRSSRVTRTEIYVVSETAVDSVFSDRTVVAFGDSITAFTGWVGMLPGFIGTNVINAGVGGNTTIHAIARLKKDIIELNPDVVIVNFGMNDAAMKLSDYTNLVSIDSYEKNMRSIITQIIAAGANVILVTPHPVCTDYGFYSAGGDGLDYSDDSFSEYIDVIRKLAGEYDTGLIDINKYCEDEDLDMICAQGDGIHLSEYGHTKYCEWISNYLLENYKTDSDFDGDTSDESDVSEVSLVFDTSDDNKNTSTAKVWAVITVLMLVCVGVIAYVLISKKRGSDF
ncbi:MAG TPA: GDSL-type esterase/lipase family protein [Bacillota bacterium]|nr:GDSL-type esterase/lipase family protein [Bacillota bacterium]